MFKKLLFAVASMLMLLTSNAQAQIQDSSGRIACKLSFSFIESMTVDSPGYGASAALTLPGSFPTAAIDTCGKFRVFYADIELAPSTGIYKGFADATLGTTRRNTMCAALNYIQSRIDFGSLADTEYIRLYVDTSCSSAFPAGTHILSGGATMYSFLAISSPYHAPMGTGDTVNGFIHDFITSGIDPNLGDYHGYLKMNFDSAYMPGTPRPILYNNDLGNPDCFEYDLCQVFIHYATHAMGWFSWSDSLHSGMGSLSNFSNYDLSLHKTPWRRFAVNPFISPTKVFPSSPVFAADYWVNGNQPPDNYPVNPSSTSHLSESYYDLRVSPGEGQAYVMAGSFWQGQKKRQFLKGEWETLHNSIGYNYNIDFASDSSIVIANHLPHSVKMGADTMNRLFYFYFIQSMQEYIPADYNLKNDLGSSVVINLNSLADLQDSDGDSISIYPGSLVNFRGCGEGGNNHNRLSVSNSGKTISYTPRANFYGRAQFGFNLWDGKEMGGFVIFTIDVSKGNNVSVLSGDNILLNGDFEEGSEIKTDDTNLNIPNGVFTRLEFSQHMSDSHPHDYSNAHFGTAIRNAHKVCTLLPDRIFYFGHDWCTFPDTFDFYGGYYIPPHPFMGVGNRYQPIATKPVTFYLADTLLPCQRYVLEFDAVRTLTPSPLLTPYPKFDSIIIGFGRDTFFNSTVRTFYTTDTKPYLTDSLKLGTWKHLSIPFTYCKDSSANIISLYIKGINGFAAPQMVDNVSLRAITEPISFNLKDSAIGNCSKRLYSDLYDLGCSSLVYEWRRLGDTTVIATTATIDITNDVEKSFTLKISDGCSFNFDTITVAPCRCMPGAVFGASSYDTLTTASVTTTLGSGVYYIPGDITIAATSIFSNGLFLIEPDVQISVNGGEKLTLDNCHLLTCPDTNKLWKGIRLATGAAIEVLNNTLIEDAIVAIDANAPSLTSGSWIINTDGATFNRNRISISINNYSPSTPVDYPFQIKNTVFTSRLLDTFSGYPSSWPSAASLKTSFPNTSSTPPFEIERNYLFAPNKDSLSIISAIKLNDVGTLAGGTYPGIQVGGVTDTGDINLFDYTGDGILANNSNISVYNNLFINMRTVPPSMRISGYPYASGSGINAVNGFQRRARVDFINGSNADLYNRFYDCLTGVRVSNYSVTNVYWNYFNSSNASPTATFRGIDISATRYDSTIISDNYMYNIPVGIYMYSNSFSSGYILGKTKIINNFIQPELPSPVIASGTEFVKQAIEVSASLMSAASAVIGNMLIKDNELTDVYNGIKLGNYMHQKGIVMSNDVIMKYENASSLQHGIYCANNTDALVYGNNVSGDGAVATDFKKRAFYNVSNKWHVVDCNTAIHTGRGFDFSGTQPRTYWRGNTMEDNIHGMALGGVIDQQGAPDYAILNEWQGAWSSNQTYCYSGVKPVLSKLFVKNTSPENPSHNGVDVFGSLDKYPNFSSIITTPIAIDDPCAPSITYIPIGASPSSFIVALKKGGIDYGGTKNAELDWIGQMSLWRMIHASDSFHYHSNNTFVDFANIADTARYGWLTAIEDALGNGDTSTAQNLLDNPVAAMGTVFIDTTLTITDSSAADYILDNYVRFYQICLQNSKGQEIDSASLADLCYKCPRLDGEVIHQARALYTQLYGIAEVYNDDSLCAEFYPQMRRADPNASTEGLSQEYGLYPNPNNGIFLIQQKEIEDKSVNLKVYNAVGSLVYQSEASFSNGKLKVQMGQQSAGLYLLCIGDAKSRTVCLRFVIK